jgi:hypothetical protein
VGYSLIGSIVALGCCNQDDSNGHIPTFGVVAARQAHVPYCVFWSATPQRQRAAVAAAAHTGPLLLFTVLACSSAACTLHDCHEGATTHRRPCELSYASGLLWSNSLCSTLADLQLRLGTERPSLGCVNTSRTFFGGLPALAQGHFCAVGKDVGRIPMAYPVSCCDASFW